MIKINGNRVELSEVENAVKKVLGLEFCAVRALEGKTGTPYLCAYYKAENPEASALNLPIHFSFDLSVDLDRMADAVSKAILMHTSLCSTIEKTEDGFLQRFDKDIRPEIVPEKMSIYLSVPKKTGLGIPMLSGRKWNISERIMTGKDVLRFRLLIMRAQKMLRMSLFLTSISKEMMLKRVVADTGNIAIHPEGLKKSL